MTAIDAKTGTVAGTLALGGKPELAVADENGKVFVNLEDKSAVVEFDSRKLAVNATWPLAPGEEPTGIALDRKHHRLFIACANKLMAVVNSENGKLVTTIPIGDGPDGAAFDSERQLAFSPNGADGTLTVAHEDSPDKYTVLENVATQKGARTLELDQKSHRVFLITAEFGPTPRPLRSARARGRQWCRDRLLCWYSASSQKGSGQQAEAGARPVFTRRKSYFSSPALLPSMNGRSSPINLSLFAILRSTMSIASSGKPDSSVKV